MDPVMKAEQELIKELEKINNIDLEKIKKAIKKAKEAHKEQKRKTGEPYVTHPLNVAKELLTFKKDIIITNELIIAAILHDTLEDTEMTEKEIETEFGTKTLMLVKGLTKALPEEDKAERNRKTVTNITRASVEEKGIIAIKIADRIDNLKTLGIFKKEKRERIAFETINIYVPLAESIGLDSKPLKELAEPHLKN